MVDELRQRAGLPMPRVYIIPSEQPNAFATGRDPNHAAVAVSQGILRLLSQDELRGVIGHELTQIGRVGSLRSDPFVPTFAPARWMRLLLKSLGPGVIT